MGESGKCRVLVVEDDAMISMLIEDMLLDLGVEVVGPVSKLEQALHLAREAEIEGAVLDINVAGELTYSVADALKARGIPVVFATGYGASALPERFRGTPILHKPFDQQTFRKALRTALSETSCEIAV